MRVTGPGRHIWISECMHACVCSVGSDSLGPVDCSPPFPLPGDLPTQGSNFHLLHCRQILYLLSHWDFSWIGVWVCVCVWVAQSCLTLCDPIFYSLPDFSIHGILQAILEWITIPFSRGTSQPRDQTQVFCLAGRFFTIWATGKSPWIDVTMPKKRRQSNNCV